MPASGINLIDANVWLALAYGGHVHHPLARIWFDAQLDQTCAFSRITQLALLRRLTNSKIMGPAVQDQQQAWIAYDHFTRDARVIFLPEPPSLEVEFRSLTQSATPRNKQWTDAYLVAFAKLSGALLVTFDHGFRTYAGLNCAVLT